jgi:RNA polymerase sigma-70 factor (ECF subfamily)
MNPALPAPLSWRANAPDNGAVPSPTEESALLRRAQAGDDEAFAVIVQRFWRKAFWTAYDVLYDHDRAQDVAQEAFVKVHRAIRTYDLDRDFASWLHRIVLNLAIDHKRRKQRDRTVATDRVEEIVDARKSTVSDAERRATVESVETILAAMPEKYRIPLTMKDIDGLSVEEIARILDLSYSTVRWRLHKARAQFRERWKRMAREEERKTQR